MNEAEKMIREMLANADAGGYWMIEPSLRKLLELVTPTIKHLQDAPRVERNSFVVTDPHSGKPNKVVFASFAACLEREANSLRSATGEKK